MRRITRRVAFAALIAMVTVGVSLWLLRPIDRVIAEWPAPATADPGADSEYVLQVVALGVNLWTIPFTRNYAILVGHPSGNSRDALAYGHRSQCSFFPGSDNIEDYIRRSTVAWTPAGVALKQPSGETLFIPREAFAGGR
jgi:hypothetical protein